MATLYHNNRKKLMQNLKDGLILVHAKDEILRNGDVTYAYRQDSNFLYLTGIEKPDHTLLLDPKTKKSHLFIPNINELHLIWVGKQLGLKEAKRLYKCDTVHFHSEFVHVFRKLGGKYKKLYALSTNRSFLKKHHTRLKKDFKILKKTLDHMRLFKSKEEIACLIKANKVSHQAHLTAMKTTCPGLYEYQIQAQMEQEFLSQGAFHRAYGSIVASGANASILHYVVNNTKCKSGDLLLIDAGCEWNGYASDVSRTFPVNGKFSKKQRQIYEIVLKTQKACIKMVKPGVSFLEIHKYSGKMIVEGLIALGIIKDIDREEIYKNDIHRIFYPHGVGHLLGLDVHDVGAKKHRRAKNLRSSITLKPGMVVTIEPGIYFIDAYFDSPKKRKEYKKYINWKKADAYRSVGGIRIEDDVLVTKTGHRNFTKVPKEIKQIEKIMKR